MRTFDFFGRYIAFTWLQPRAPVYHWYEVNEIDKECRTSTALFIRIWPLRIGVAFGRWEKTGLTQSQMFARVFTSRELNMLDENGEILPQYAQAARAAIADSIKDPDDEWEILRMTGLDK